MKSKKITFIIGKFALGGVTRNTANLANELVSQGFLVEIVALHGVDIPIETFKLNEGVKTAVLSSRRTILNLYGLIPLAFYFCTQRPNLIISAVEYVNIIALIAHVLSGKKGVFLTTTRTDLTIEYSKNPKKIHIPEKYLASKLYWLANQNIAVSKGVAESMNKEFSLKRDPHVIYNPAARPDVFIEPKRSEPREEFHFVSCGRLSTQKNFPFMLRVFKSFVEEGITKKIKLKILGEGPELQNVKNLIDEFNLQDVVSLVGRVDRPQDYFREAHCFVLTSDWEGFGNVIVEALATGLYVVSTNCPSGPAEILTEEKFGKLVEVNNLELFKEELKKVIANYSEIKLSENYRVRRAYDFSPENISRQYLAYLNL